MNREEALKASDDAVKELIEALKQGKSEKLIEYLDTVSRFHKYSLGNVLMILRQKPDATYVAGFNRWKELYRWVKKEEKGIAILAPMIIKAKKESEGDSATKDSDTAKSKVLRGFRVVYVFDVSQTEGKELPALGHIGGDPGSNLLTLDAFIRECGIELSYVESLGGALGVSEGGKIKVLSTLSKAETFSTLVHELAHELLHRGDRRESTSKSMRETEAEAVAYVVTKATGLEVSTQSVDYIQLWDGNADVLLASLELVREVASKILTALESPVNQEAAQVA